MFLEEMVLKLWGKREENDVMKTLKKKLVRVRMSRGRL